MYTLKQIQIKYFIPNCIVFVVLSELCYVLMRKTLIMIIIIIFMIII